MDSGWYWLVRAKHTQFSMGGENVTAGSGACAKLSSRNAIVRVPSNFAVSSRDSAMAKIWLQTRT